MSKAHQRLKRAKVRRQKPCDLFISLGIGQTPCAECKNLINRAVAVVTIEKKSEVEYGQTVPYNLAFCSLRCLVTFNYWKALGLET